MRIRTRTVKVRIVKLEEYDIKRAIIAWIEKHGVHGVSLDHVILEAVDGKIVGTAAIKEVEEKDGALKPSKRSPKPRKRVKSEEPPKPTEQTASIPKEVEIDQEAFMRP